MFRYSRSQFNYSLLNMGIIRIGTLHDFRLAEHAQGIADPNEGKKTVSHHVNYLHVPDSSDTSLASSKDFRSLSQFRAIKLEGSTNTTIQNCTFVQQFDEPDCFILCTSKIQSRETMNQFEGADSCIEIIDINKFYSVLTETLNSLTPVIFRGIHEVIYKNREEQWNGQDWGHHPALIKETKFRKQHELRAIWQSRLNKHISPIILGHHNLSAYCRIVRI